jgi:division protein CdvB (Snf7/Vps24/ESCRT-III family)
MSFAKRWEKKDDPSQYDKMVEAIKPSDPLKMRLVASIKRIELENQRLDQGYDRFQKREKELFDKVVEAYKGHDDRRANIYAVEVAEIRKIEKMIFQMKLALEQISLRMRTSTELGDVAASLLPVVDTMNELQAGITSINPQTDKELGELGDLLSGMVADAGMVGMGSISFEAVNEDSSKILGEAQVVAESRIGDGFPQLPGKMRGQSIVEDDSKP